MRHNCIWVGWLQPPNENYLTTGMVFPRKWWRQTTVKTTENLSENHIIFLNLFGHEFWGSTRSGGLQIPGPPSCSKFMACNSQASPTSPVFAQKCQSLISVGIWSRDIPSKKIKERVLSDNNQNNQLLVCAFKPLQIWSCLVKTKVPVVSGDNCLFCCPLQQLDKFVLTAFGWMITTPTWSEWTWTIRIYQLEKQQLW